MHPEAGQGFEVPRGRALVLERQIRQREVETGLGVGRRREHRPSEEAHRRLERVQMVLGEAEAEQRIERGRIIREGLAEPGGRLEVAPVVQGGLPVLVGRDAAGEEQDEAREKAIRQAPAGGGHG